jgi:predicted helicase
MTTVHDVLRMIRRTSKDNHERGTRFEQLMVKFLRTDPQWNKQFSQGRLARRCSEQEGQSP